MPVDLSRVPAFYHKYISMVKEADLDTAFKSHQTNLVSVLKNLPDEKWNFRYAKDKWTVKDLIQHIIDSERIFCYRALRFSRKDRTELPGFDENAFAKTAEADRRKGNELIEELECAQKSSAQLFGSFSKEQLSQSGVANGNPVYVEAIGYIIVGHTLHHLGILRERYGVV